MYKFLYSLEIVSTHYIFGNETLHTAVPGTYSYMKPDYTSSRTLEPENNRFFGIKHGFTQFVGGWYAQVSYTHVKTLKITEKYLML